MKDEFDKYEQKHEETLVEKTTEGKAWQKLPIGRIAWLEGGLDAKRGWEMHACCITNAWKQVQSSIALTHVLETSDWHTQWSMEAAKWNTSTS